MHQSLERAGDVSLARAASLGRIAVRETIAGARAMSPRTLAQMLIVMAVSAAAVPMMTAYNAKTHAWIVLDFKTTRGHLTQMAFSNPDTLNEDECRQSIPQTLESLIAAAIAQTPALRRATVTGARCMMSVGDPLKKPGKVKS